MASATALWPAQKVKETLNGLTGELRKQAVLLYRGTMNPPHLGDVLKICWAQERLERAGYTVVGAWLIPSCELKVQQEAKAEHTVALSGELRLQMASALVENHKLIAVSPAEALGDELSLAQVQASLTAAFVDLPPKVFIACTSSESEVLKRFCQGTELGVVVEPIDDGIYMEKPTAANPIYVTDPLPEKVAALTAGMIQTALRGGDVAFVRQVMPEALSRLLYRPTEAEKIRFASDFGQLQPSLWAPPGPWSTDRFMNKMLSLPQDQAIALILLSSSFNPPHQGHMLAIREAVARLERVGYYVAGAWLSPVEDSAAQAESRRLGLPALSANLRIRLCELTALSDDLVATATTEAFPQADGPRDRVTVASSLRSYLQELFPGSLQDRRIVVFTLHSNTTAKLLGARAQAADAGVGLVIVPSDEEDLVLETPTQLTYATEALPEGLQIQSSKPCHDILSGNRSAAAKGMVPAAARLLLEPSQAEVEAFKADYAALKIQVSERDEIAESKLKLCATLQQWLGNQTGIHPEDLRRILKALDSSWTEEDLSTLLDGAQKSENGLVPIEEFLDWVFSARKVSS